MWPEPGQAVSHMLASEQAVEDLYAEALRRWAPDMKRYVLPVLTAASLPVDPGGVAQAHSVWDRIADTLIVKGLGLLWSATLVQARRALGLSLPQITTVRHVKDYDSTAVSIVATSTDMTRKEVAEAASIVESDPAYRAARDSFLDAQRQRASYTPADVQDKIQSAINNAGTPDTPAAAEELRAVVEDVVEPGSPELRTVARVAGYQAAGVQNDAILQAAKSSEDADELDKVWICVHPDTVVSASGVTHLARRHYKGTLVSVRTRSGSAVALTPKHRVLTGRGWVQAQFLHVGDDLFKVGRADAPDRAPHVEDSPATIGQIVDAAMNDPATKVRTVRRSVDLDGDAGCSYVDVVPTGGDLAVNPQTGRGEAFRDLLLADADLLGHAAMLGLCALDDRRGGFDSPAVLVSDAAVKLSLHCGGDFGRPQLPGFGFVSDLDASGSQYLGNLGAAAGVALAERRGRLPGEVCGGYVATGGVEVVPVTCGDGEALGLTHLRESLGPLRNELPRIPVGTDNATSVESADHCLRADSIVGSDHCSAFTREVAPDDIVAIEMLGHDGYVYDLSTWNHWYLANDLVIHNCTLDGKTRPTHFAADGQRAPIASTFTVGGEQLAYPGDPTASAAERINCRCRLGVLAHDEELPDEVDRHTERPGIASSTEVNRDGRTQAQEIEKRAGEGTVRAREDPEGIGRTAAVTPTERDDMTTSTRVKPSDLNVSRRAAFKVGDVDADGNTVVAEGYTDAAGNVVFTDDDGADMYRTFTNAIMAKLGEQTSDGRMLAADIDLSFREMPLPLMWMKQTGSGFGGHTEAFTVGVIESAKKSGSDVLASGYLLNSPEADECADQIMHGVTGPSVDLGAVEWMLTDEDGKEISEEDWWDMPIDATVIQTITAAELIGTTLCATPAFGTTTITLDADRSSREPAMVASAAAEFRPPVYDHRLFENPKLSGPTLPTMGEDGRIYGHLACFGACHRSIQSECIMAPRSPSDYSNFHTSPAVKLDNDVRLPVGRLTVGTGHASDKLRPGPAMSHYDNTGTCFALVRVGEDKHGVWFSGVAAPWATAEQVQMGIASPLSGDWRDFGKGLDLIAALAVNTPGFAARGRSDEQGRPLALVASIGPSPATERGGSSLSLADIKAAVREAMVEQQSLSAFTAARDAALARADQILDPLPAPLTPSEKVAALLAGISPTANDGGLPTQIDVDPMDNASPQTGHMPAVSGPKPTRKPAPNTVASDVSNGASGTINAPIPPAKSNPSPSPLTGKPTPSAGTAVPS